MGKKGFLVGLGKRSRRSRHRHDEVLDTQSLATRASYPMRDVEMEENISASTQSFVQEIEVGQMANENTRYGRDYSAELAIPNEALHASDPELLSIETEDAQAGRNTADSVEIMDEEEDQFADEAEDPSNGYMLTSDGCRQDLRTEEYSRDCELRADEEQICPNMEQVHLLDNWRVLWALFLTNGSRKLTKEQYQSVRNLASGFAAMSATTWNTGSSQCDFGGANSREKLSVLPHYSTIHKKYKPLVLNVLAPREIEHMEDVDESKAGARISSRSTTGEGQIAVRTILPSEYARTDMATPDVWSEMRSTSLSCAENLDTACPSLSSVECVDTIPIVGARRWFYGHQSSMIIDSNSQGDSPYAEAGDIVRVTISGGGTLNEVVQRCFGVNGVEDAFEGVFAHSWTVHEDSREQDESFKEDYKYEVSPRDRTIATSLNYLKYKSPTDAVTVHAPRLPRETEAENCGNGNYASPRQSVQMVEASRRRRDARRERNRQMDAVWGLWQKPIFKPGDFVVLIRPCTDQERARRGNASRTSTLLTNIDRSSRLCVVHRFWAEREERSRHSFFISGGCDLGNCTRWDRSEDPSLQQYCTAIYTGTNEKTVNVRSIRLEEEHFGPRGPQKHVPISSVGVLDSGELYFIYRIILFWDGFNFRSGNSASGEGIYMICLNLPRNARTSSSAVRILILTPPGVKNLSVLNRILRDIMRGATDGVIDYDADGKKRRIFIDLVGVFGDTPAINGAIDVLGHTANSCCHLCRFIRRSNTEVGSRYANTVGNGSQSAYRRGYYQHAAMHDCEAGQETCRLNGVRSKPSVAELPLHAFKQTVDEAKGRIQTVQNRIPVIPHYFDPYKGSFAAPDHLLSGHMRDCISLVLKLLPTRKYLEAWEKTMLRYLAEAELPCQNRFVDLDSKSLYTMSMTEMYALGFVAEISFRHTCAAMDQEESASPIPQICNNAIDLVGSCANLISEIWRRPDKHRDGIAAVNNYERNHGTSTLNHLKLLVNDHIGKVEAICEMNDEEKEELVSIQREISLN